MTDFKEFPGRTHFIIGRKGWEEVADYVLGWLQKQKVLADSVRAPLAA